MYRVFIWFICIQLVCVQNLFIPKDNSKNYTAEEVQNAICTITTKEIEASANATITRELKGVCTSNELNLKIDKLQTTILQEIDGIKYVLEANGFRIPEVILKNAPSAEYQVYSESPIYKVGNTAKVLPRIEEILMYNDTILDSSDGRKYVYYWKLQNIQELLAKREMYKSSSDFLVLGHTLHLQLYPNHLQNNFFGIQLRPNSDGFLKKHKIIILNQLKFGSDIDSVILYGRGTIFRTSENNLVVEGFILENSLLVKLEIYLDS